MLTGDHNPASSDDLAWAAMATPAVITPVGPQLWYEEHNSKIRFNWSLTNKIKLIKVWMPTMTFKPNRTRHILQPPIKMMMAFTANRRFLTCKLAR